MYHMYVGANGAKPIAIQ